MKKQRKHTRRGTYYHTLAKGYAALNAPIRADIFQGTADYFDDNDLPPDQVAETDKAKKDDTKKDHN